MTSSRKFGTQVQHQDKLINIKKGLVEKVIYALSQKESFGEEKCNLHCNLQIEAGYKESTDTVIIAGMCDVADVGSTA